MSTSISVPNKGVNVEGHYSYWRKVLSGESGYDRLATAIGLKRILECLHREARLSLWVLVN